jgi:hypothetical protein
MDNVQKVNNVCNYFSLLSGRIGYGLDGRGVGVRGPVGLKIFSSPRRLGPT